MPSTALYALMALDAYDPRSSVLEPRPPAFADPEVAQLFPGWVHLPLSGDYGPRDSTVSLPNGVDYNVYRNDGTSEVVVAFRGTEFGYLTEGLAAGDIGTLRTNNLLGDGLSLFGYYQDGGDTLAATLGPLGGSALVQGLARAGEAVLADMGRSAVRAVLEAVRDNPGTAVTVTGHSLGGALAAYAASALGVQAAAIDPAPWAAQPFLAELRGFADDLLAGEFAGLDLAAAGIAITGDAAQTGADRVETVRLEGSFVEDAYLTADPGDLPPGGGTDTVLPFQAAGATGQQLHIPEVIALVINSAASEAQGRPSLQSLDETLPGLVGRITNGEPIFEAAEGPRDLTETVFLRDLLLEDAFYRLFADVAEALADVLAPYDGGDAEGLAEAATDHALAFLAGIAGNGAFGAGQTAADVLGSPTGSDGADVIVGTAGVPDILAPGLGTDFVAPGARAADTVTGTLAELDGDTLYGIGWNDTLVFEGASFGPEAVTAGRNGLSIDADGDGTAEAEIALVALRAGTGVDTQDLGGATALSFGLPLLSGVYRPEGVGAAPASDDAAFLARLAWASEAVDDGDWTIG